MPDTACTEGSAAGCPDPHCTITSQTHSTSPANRERIRIGVGEEVTLTYSPGSATWEEPENGTLDTLIGSSVMYTAGEAAGEVTLTANGPNGSGSITFTVVIPESWSLERELNFDGTPSDLKHTHNNPDCGWRGIAFVHPNDVNFYRVEVCECDSQATAHGCFSILNHRWHGNYGDHRGTDQHSEWIPLVNHSDEKGSSFDGADEIYAYPGTRRAGRRPPFHRGRVSMAINWKWKVAGSSQENDFPEGITQEHVISATGRSVSAKAGNSEHTMYNDPSSEPLFWGT